MPQSISIGSGNSVIEWILMPRMAELNKVLPKARFECVSDRTRVIVSQLLDLTLDIGIIRDDAVQRPLKTTPLTSITYSIFVPKKLSPGVHAENIRKRIAQIPLATAMGGTFRDTLETGAGKLGWPLEIVMSCSSFTQAARLVLSGIMGASCLASPESTSILRALSKFRSLFSKTIHASFAWRGIRASSKCGPSSPVLWSR